MATPKQCTLCVGRGPDEVIRKRLSFLRMYTLTSGLRRTPHRHVPSGAIGGRLFHLRVGSNKTARSAYLRVKFHLGLFFRSSLRLEMFKTNWWTRLEWFWLPGMPDRRSRKLKQARRLPTALQLRTFARTDHSLAKRTPKWQSASGRSVKTFTSLQTKRCLDPRRENPPDLVRGRSQQAAKPAFLGGGGMLQHQFLALRTLHRIALALPWPSPGGRSGPFDVPARLTSGAILASRVHPWRSGLTVGHGDAARREQEGQLVEPGRENPPALDRDRPIPTDDTPETSAAAAAAIFSRAKGRQAPTPSLLGNGGLFLRRPFALWTLDSIPLTLPPPSSGGRSGPFAVLARSSLGPILARRVRPLRSRLTVGHGDVTRRGREGQWVESWRENPPALDRSRPIAGNDTPETSAVAGAAIFSGAKARQAAMPRLLGSGRFFLQRPFALRTLDPIPLSLPPPSPGGRCGPFAVPARSTLEPILGPRVHPWRSGSPVEAGLGEPGEQWLDQGRENSPILDRSRPIAAGDTPDALAAATTAVSSRAKGWRAAMPVLSGGGGLLHRRAFSLRASNQTMLRLPGPDMRGLKESDQNLQGDLPAAGDTSPPRLVHVERSAGSIPRQSEAKPAEAGEERSRSYSMAEPGFARRKAGAITDLKAATRRDIQTVAQQVYELIVDRVRREKERLGC
jgi:hypothetical protein